MLTNMAVKSSISYRRDFKMLHFEDLDLHSFTFSPTHVRSPSTIIYKNKGENIFCFENYYEIMKKKRSSNYILKKMSVTHIGKRKLAV